MIRPNVCMLCVAAWILVEYEPCPLELDQYTLFASLMTVGLALC